MICCDIPEPTRFQRWRWRVTRAFLRRIYNCDFSHFPQWAKRRLWRYQEVRFNKFNFPVIRRVREKRIYKFMGQWWCETHYYEPEEFPLLSTEELLSVQPLAGGSDLKFSMKFVNKAVQHALGITYR